MFSVHDIHAMCQIFNQITVVYCIYITKYKFFNKCIAFNFEIWLEVYK